MIHVWSCLVLFESMSLSSYTNFCMYASKLKDECLKTYQTNFSLQDDTFFKTSFSA